MRYVAALMAMLVLSLSGCGDKKAEGFSLSDCVGLPCTVQFQRDLLGTTADLPVGPETGSINGAKVCVSGKLLKANSEWVVLLQDDDASEYWIPRDNVLLVSVRKRRE